jgi:hypothetical protein
MPSKVKVLPFLLVIVGAVVGNAVMMGRNDQLISFHLYSFGFDINSGTLAMMFFACGTIFGTLWPYAMGANVHEQNVTKLKEWQTQDQKLAIEVQRDKEKQLEAKIATLEAALKQALNK